MSEYRLRPMYTSFDIRKIRVILFVTLMEVSSHKQRIFFLPFHGDYSCTTNNRYWIIGTENTFFSLLTYSFKSSVLNNHRKRR